MRVGDLYKLVARRVDSVRLFQLIHQQAGESPLKKEEHGGYPPKWRMSERSRYQRCRRFQG
jgi:hypothetical protein